MNKKLVAVGLSAALFFAGYSCSHRRDREAAAGERALSRTADAGPGAKTGQGVGRGGGRDWDNTTSLRLTDAEMKAIDLATVQASYQPISSRLRATGKVLASPFRKAIVSYPFPARIAQIHVRPGDWVKTGQELITLQSEAVGEAKSEYFKALADCELAESSYERERRLFNRGAGAGKNLQAAEAERKVAEASVNAAEKKLHVLGFTEAQVKTAADTHEINATITLFAPLPGKIVDNNMALGTMVDQSTEILTILDPSVLCVDADIYERDIAAVQKDQEVELTVPAYPDLVFKGRIQYIGDVLKEATRTVTVRTEVKNEGFRLKPGMFASLTILLDRQARALTLPLAAVLDDQDRKIVFLSRDGAFFPRVILTGPKMDGLIEVLSGIAEGDSVVTRGNYQLKSKLYDEILKGSHIH
jgi:cobalt-zinc-cadmium efflux system membrane fusion protein